MNRLSLTAEACLVAALCQGCVAQPAQEMRTRGLPVPVHPAAPTAEQIAKIKNPPEKPVISKERLAQIQQGYARYRALAYTDGIECKPNNDYVCQNPVTVYMFQWKDPNTNERFCLGLIPKYVLFTGTAGGNQPKRIVWELKPLDSAVAIDPANSRFEFLGDGDQGILVFQNIDTGGNQQLREGKRGSRPGNADIDKFHIKNLHNRIGTAAYLPIIVHRVPATGGGMDEVAICGTPDPLIYNVQ